MSHFLPPSRWRVRIFYVFMFVAAVALVGRLFTLQVLNQATYAEQALENRVSRVSIPAPRGIIYDSRGVPLALNQPAFDVVITPANLPDDQAQVQAIYTRLATLLNMPVTVPGSTPVAPCRTGPPVARRARPGGRGPGLPALRRRSRSSVTSPRKPR